MTAAKTRDRRGLLKIQPLVLSPAAFYLFLKNSDYPFFLLKGQGPNQESAFLPFVWRGQPLPERLTDLPAPEEQ
ncbi:MAG: hypothetical protein H6Q42_872 [Deltaproteobacteria bacterium]|nr:hypothetical protein [Deltaproteobacteria bacterium]